jgi:hypothetical protein
MIPIEKMSLNATLGAVLCAGFVAVAPSAQAALVFDVSAMPPKAEVRQNTTLTITFRATMSLASTAPDVKMFLDDRSLKGVSIVLNNASDNMDKIMNGSLVEGGTCFLFDKGKVVGQTIFRAGNSCTFKEAFPTQDPRSPDPDKIAGDWTVTQSITGRGKDVKDNLAGTLTPNFSFNAIVTDVPEPSTWAMMAAGLGALGGALRCSRLRRGRGCPSAA